MVQEVFLSFFQVKNILTYGKKIDLNNPKTFNEKLQWLKLNDHNDDYMKMVDKSLVKDYISEKIGNQYVIKTLWEGKKYIDIPYDSLPEQFVIKCTHGSHCSIIVKDKSLINKKEINKKLRKWMKRNWYWYGREWPYKELEPKIIVEQYMEDAVDKELVDYKIYCFNGEPKVVDVCGKRYSKDEKMSETYFDSNWNFLGFKTIGHEVNKSAKKPKTFDKMLEISKKLSKGIRFIRVDLYEINGRLYFGELTFFSANGFEEWEPEKWNEYLGDYIKLDV